MKKQTILKPFLVFLGLIFYVTMAGAQEMKMVVDNQGEVVGRYVRTNANTYTVAVQDDCEVPKAGNKVVTFKAANGQGILYRNMSRKGNINVRKAPNLKAAVIEKIPEFDGLPEAYDCLGVVKGWYKLYINGKIGYCRMDMLTWDGMLSF